MPSTRRFTTGGIYGVFVLQSPRGVSMNVDDQEFADEVAKVVGLALSTVQLWSQLEASNQELTERVRVRTADVARTQSLLTLTSRLAAAVGRSETGFDVATRTMLETMPNGYCAMIMEIAGEQRDGWSCARSRTRRSWARRCSLKSSRSRPKSTPRRLATSLRNGDPLLIPHFSPEQTKAMFEPKYHEFLDKVAFGAMTASAIELMKASGNVAVGHGTRRRHELRRRQLLRTDRPSHRTLANDSTPVG